MLTVDGWRLTVNSQQWTRIYYSDANGFDIIGCRIMTVTLNQPQDQRLVGVADLRYERLNLQKMKQASQSIFWIFKLSIFLPWFSNARLLIDQVVLNDLENKSWNHSYILVLCATLPLVTASLFLDQDADKFWEPMSANTTLKPHLEGTPAQSRATVVFPDHPFLDKS
jgi:hypothetical protein